MWCDVRCALVLGLGLAMEVVVGCGGSPSEGPHDGGGIDAAGTDARASLDASHLADAATDAGARLDGATLDGGGSDGGAMFLMPPAVTCQPVGSACDVVTVDPGIHASYRKDHYLPSSDYSEPNPEPLDGGRFHIATVAQASGAVTDVQVDGQSVADLLVEPLMEWYHVWPDPVVAGEPMWVAFHSRSPHWDSAASGQIRVVTSGGDAVNGTFSVQQTPTPLTYVTTTDDFGAFLVHLKNPSTAAVTVSRVLLNGREVLQHGACVPSTTVAPGEAVMWTVPLCSPTYAGAPWTVVVELAGAPPAVGVGRVLRPFFPIEAWPTGSACPFPGGEQANFDRHRTAGIDTLYMYWGGNHNCSYDAPTVANQLLPALGDTYVLVGDDFLNRPSPESAITDSSAIAGFLTGDESDGEMYEGGVPKASIKAAKARQLWAMYPELTVYNGAMTNRNVGAFAGMVDVQGIDFYVAACAPHITTWGVQIPLRGPHDYLKNARNNHMPLPTWFYAQGLHSGWNQSGLLGEVHVQPDPQEILAQAFMVMTAGGKGLMWFQSNLDEADHAPARWAAITRANRMFRAVRAYVRAGDITGLADAGPDVLAELIRAPGAIVVPLVNLRTTQQASDIGCAGSFLSESSVPHWVMDSHAVDVQLTIPADFGVREVLEVTDTQVSVAPYAVSISGRQLTLQGVALDNQTPVRLLVLAEDPTVAADIAAVIAALP